MLDAALRDSEMREELAPVELLCETETPVKDARDFLVGALLSLDEEAAAKLIRTAALETT